MLLFLGTIELTSYNACGPGFEISHSIFYIILFCFEINSKLIIYEFKSIQQFFSNVNNYD